MYMKFYILYIRCNINTCCYWVSKMSGVMLHSLIHTTTQRKINAPLKYNVGSGWIWVVSELGYELSQTGVRVVLGTGNNKYGMYWVRIVFGTNCLHLRPSDMRAHTLFWRCHERKDWFNFRVSIIPWFFPIKEDKYAVWRRRRSQSVKYDVISLFMMSVPVSLLNDKLQFYWCLHQFTFAGDYWLSWLMLWRSREPNSSAWICHVSRYLAWCYQFLTI